MSKKKYYYDLPEKLIAKYPAAGRKSSRLLSLNKESGEIKHDKFDNIINYFSEGDVLVMNNTKVIPARLLGNKDTGAAVEIFLLNRLGEKEWECLVKPGRKLKPGVKINFRNMLTAEIIAETEDGKRKVKFSWEGSFFDVLEKTGEIPLPPYLNRKAEDTDRETYQTVYAEHEGSVAAPTAGLHFTEDIIGKLKDKGVIVLNVLLHVGLGTFRPVKTDDITQHVMHSEYCEISEDVAKAVNSAKAENRRVIAVGTTSTRTLESFASDGVLESGKKWTDIFIYPGKKFQIIDGLVTNFHMPESTLLMLVSAFAGYEKMMNAYREAVESEYRFFSYGDSMIIL
ncbi:MAG: tRNA preQ1(34) S-adenosylmethionine ribosyltransferase-isomerase QueA [Candidatus Cloacimonadota bacterium]|nr:MAG: tRNA preQ1(34) S-adenosylmethionine ribosyltransferase-isomerase QueA [Candidatus Cloacimonadota bacterium]